jgi:hypothetical protein
VAFCVAGVVVLVGLGLHLATPRTQGLDGDWSANAVEGTVVAGRALVSGDHTALDLRTGKTVTLGSVRGGTPFIADERLIIATDGRIDSVRLDATVRWTWHSPAGTTATPLAASGGSTLVDVCPAAGACRLVGLNAQGRQDWQSDGATRREQAPRDGSLPRVHATSVPGGGVLLTDPVSGRSTLRAGRSFLAIPNGPVVTELVQDGKCVVSAYSAADALWTRVLDECPASAMPVMGVGGGAVMLTWLARVGRLDLATGKTLPIKGATIKATTTETTGKVVGQGGGLTAIQSQKTLRTNPFRWGTRVTVIELRDSTTGDEKAEVVSDQPLTLVHLDKDAIVVRDGSQVVRYTFGDHS